MKDEIKEKIKAYYIGNDIDEVLDGITNLQEEVKSANESIIWWQNRFNALQKENERLNNIIKPKEVNYNYLKLLFKKKDKEEVIKSYVYKCEQLEKLYKSYEEKEIELMKKDNIIDELEKIINDYQITSKLDSDYELICQLKEKLKALKESK